MLASLLFYWLIYGLLTWVLVALLNATAFKQQPSTRTTAWALTVGMFFINLFAMTALEILHYEAISDNLGVPIRPKNSVDFLGAFMFSSLFFSLLRKLPKVAKARITATAPGSVSVAATQSPLKTARRHPQQSVLSIAPLTPSHAGAEPTEEFWATALSEFEGTIRRPGLWARAFADAQGNEAVAKATYLRDRASELAHGDRLRLAEEERQAKQLEREAELDRLSTEQRAYTLLPKGRCPNTYCHYVMPLSETSCSKCDATFGVKGGWNLIPIEEF